MASLPLINWRLTESTRPASTSGSILCGIFKGAFLRRVGARGTTMDCFGTDFCAGAHNLQQMTLKRQDLEDITTRTLEHYDRGAEGFWKGTRDHDVSQNIAALLRHIEG